ncbi:RNA polymerase subunit sigma-70 [Herbaspirillum rubrisubalbicans Os34]|uniref:RNA polymerase subunit sigma-70 n=2 Tax=Herbaspirillum rubrisubalbicans TaxID=80842 RepID=A0A6M3ZPM0_9BURK|nr:sigma-70 family RNA polymerase sigma factor [Herbaspirillum rubrisubalbicans]QJP99939.1 RNA polymerase subunit sigma-70 [Herbaspirillum rubrisubalbicans Os34]
MSSSMMSDRLGAMNKIEAMFIEHHGWLRTRLRRSVGDAYAADDVAAETFTQLLSSPPPQEVREPRALLTTISRRIVYELWRRRDLEEACLQALAHHREQDQAISPEDQLQLLQALRAMDQALAGLSAKECAAFLLYKLDGLTYQAIGEQLRIPPSVARRYVAKGLLQCYKAAGFAPLE